MSNKFKLADGHALILRTCDKDGRSYGGFQWPESGPVEATDWQPIAQCGNGLHGFLWGEGNGQLAKWELDTKWLVVDVLESDVVKIDSQKVKYPRGTVVFYGDRLGATQFVANNGGHGRAIVGGTATAGTAALRPPGTAALRPPGTAALRPPGTTALRPPGTAALF